MSNPSNLPDPKIIEKAIGNLRSVGYQLDALTFNLDELIAMVEEDIRNNPVNTYRRQNNSFMGEKNTTRSVTKFSCLILIGFAVNFQIINACGLLLARSYLLFSSFYYISIRAPIFSNIFCSCWSR